MIKKAILFSYILVNTCIAKDWGIEITPLVWNANMSGTVQINTQKAHIDRDKLSGVIFLEAEKNKLGFISEFAIAHLSDTYRRSNYTIKATNDFGIINLFLSYRMISSLNYFVKLYGGGRYTQKKSSITIYLNNASTTLNQNLSWTDPVIGLNFHYNIYPNFSAKVYADIGGTNTTNDYSYEVIGLLGLSKCVNTIKYTAYLGYQILDQHYIRTNNQYINWNVKMSGPLMGVSIRF